ncbi:hypothetical protein O0S10_01450 [Methanocorpusculum sp. MG]|uniref:DUF5050 domain-containing protein n=1 Tax=Methanocorpusculum petauri TaxID=3002863 RepID=A0ABT4IE90_9EURY|nr:hypothetical protein [Methanocorpusculum petauri]MCZ0859891.1 hypothetical protein [Methanocorpusculum petauri]
MEIRENINTHMGKRSGMNRCVYVFLFCVVVSCCIFSASALDVNIVGEPEIICEFQEGYAVNDVILNENYILLTEYLWNDAVSRENQEGYLSTGSMYLYDINKKTLTPIPGNIPSSSAQLAKNGTVYWITPSYCIPNGDQYGNTISHREFYSYTPGDASPVKHVVPGNDFLTDGQYFLSMQSDYWPRDASLTLSDLRTGEKKSLYLNDSPSPSAVLLSGDTLVYYSELPMGVSDAENQIHVYNISSGTEILLSVDVRGYSRILQNLWGEKLVYDLYDPVKKSSFTPPIFEMFDLSTGDTESLVLPDGVYASRMYPPYAVLSEYDSSRDTITFRLATLDMPPITQATPILPTEKQTLPPQPTQAGSPLALTIGLIAFVLACVFAVLWREK